MAVQLVTQEELGNQGLDYLLGNGTVDKVSEFSVAWRNTIYPISTKVLKQYVLDHNITQLPNLFFGDMYVMPKQTYVRYEEGPYDIVEDRPRLFGKKLQARVIGSIADSVKRYQDVDKHLTVDMQITEAYIRSVVSWARAKGMLHIYCITEHRPNVVNDDYVLNAVYYTVTGA